MRDGNQLDLVLMDTINQIERKPPQHQAPGLPPPRSTGQRRLLKKPARSRDFVDQGLSKRRRRFLRVKPCGSDQVLFSLRGETNFTQAIAWRAQATTRPRSAGHRPPPP